MEYEAICGCLYTDDPTCKGIKFCQLHNEALNLLSVASYALGVLISYDPDAPVIKQLRRVTDKATGRIKEETNPC